MGYAGNIVLFDSTESKAVFHLSQILLVL